MSKKKSIIQKMVVCTFVMALSLLPTGKQVGIVEITDEPVTLSSTMGTLIRETDADITIMPDKYNTGAKGELRTVGLSETVNGIVFVAGNEGTINALDFPKRNPNVSGIIVFEDIDFSAYPLSMYRESDISNNIKVIFNNCIFSHIATGKKKVNISYEFNNCTINSFKGSNAVFNNCMFGGTFKDGIVPYCNVTVNNSFFCDMASDSENGSGLHTDGTQIYGFADLDVTNVYYNNCRFEIPAIQTGGSTAEINACIMLQLEYSNAKDMKFSKCTINGGGYSLYARDKNKGFTFTNVKFEDIQIGCSKLYGSIYPKTSPGIIFNNVGETQNLYIGSVWRDNEGTHISVTNDTNQERILLIYADGEMYENIIPACPDGNNLLPNYEAYPFDIDVVIPSRCDYIACYDNTMEGMVKQIRYVNWSGLPVYLDREIKDSIYGNENAKDDILLSGSCGKNITFELTKAGVLSLSGIGATDNYHSAKPVPWSEYKYLINQIIIGEGIDTLGTQLFIECQNVNTVVLPEGMKYISSRVFSKCSSLQNVNLPITLEKIGDYAFLGTLIQNIHYEGSEEGWENVILGINNEPITSNIIIDIKKSNDITLEGIKPLVSSGECGKNIVYELTVDGILRLSGEGVTYNYHSANVAPWFEYRDCITSIEIGEGITGLGTQLCRQCRKLETVIIPQSLKIIGGNAFIQCSSLKSIVIPRNVISIQRYAFAGTNLCQTIYMGTEEDWAKVYIGYYNEKLLNLVNFFKE